MIRNPILRAFAACCVYATLLVVAGSQATWATIRTWDNELVDGDMNNGTNYDPDGAIDVAKMFYDAVDRADKAERQRGEARVALERTTAILEQLDGIGDPEIRIARAALAAGEGEG